MLPFLNNPKDLDPSYKTNLDLWDCFGRKNLCLITEEIRYTDQCVFLLIVLTLVHLESSAMKTILKRENFAEI